MTYDINSSRWIFDLNFSIVSGFDVAHAPAKSVTILIGNLVNFNNNGSDK